MRCRSILAATVSAIVLHGGGVVALGGEQTVSRTLSVEQTSIKDVAPPVGPTQSRADTLDVRAWVDRPDFTYSLGEYVRIFVQTNKDAYVTVLNVDPAGATTILFPNQYQPNNRVRAQRAIEVPAPDSGSQVVVRGPVGTELLKVIASTEPVDLLEALQLAEAGPFQTVAMEPARITRSLKVAMTEPRPVATSPSAAVGVQPVSFGTEWAMCHQSIATIPVPTLVAQRTRSLQVLRTENDAAVVACD